MKFTNKLAGILILRVIVDPLPPSDISILLTTLWAIIEGANIFLYAIFWEFLEQLSDITAFNELVEKKIRRKTMKLLDFFVREL